MKRFSLVAACLFFVIAVRAQPTTYFPHHLGDMWEYFVLDGVGNDTLQVRVIFDSTDPGGSSHVRHHRQLVNPIRPPWFGGYNEYRVDTTGRIFGTGLSPPNRLVYRLDVQVGEWWFVHRTGPAEGDIAKLVDEYPATVFGQPTTVKEIWYFFASDTSDTTIWLWQYTELLAEGFGAIFRGDGDLGYNLYLMGCKIGGVLYGDTTVVSVDERTTELLPGTFVLHQNYPNPFNPRTTIEIDLPEASIVGVKVYDVIGRHVATIVEGKMGPGVHRFLWDATPLPSGVYFGRMQVRGNIQTIKMALMR